MYSGFGHLERLIRYATEVVNWCLRSGRFAHEGCGLSFRPSALPAGVLNRIRHELPRASLCPGFEVGIYHCPTHLGVFEVQNLPMETLSPSMQSPMMVIGYWNQLEFLPGAKAGGSEGPES